MADFALPATPDAYALAAADPMRGADATWDDRPAE
jgi:hypothetical protein